MPPICPDCGLTLVTPKTDMESRAPVVCPECLAAATPEPDDGWPIVARWIGPGKGRGVFAKRALVAGETVERCWVMPLSAEESQQSLSMPVLNRYLFPWVGDLRVIISGEGLLYNFDRLEVTRRGANLECVLRQGISAIEFRALREVSPGEELTWDYQHARLKLR